MGQILACTRRKQLDKFADEEPKSPISPIVGPPVRETVYIAYVLFLAVARQQPCLSVHQGHGTDWQWKDDGMSLG